VGRLEASDQYSKMGHTLSSPVTEKHSIDGKFRDRPFGVSEMQGWRPTMEDAYIAEPEFASNVLPNASLFAVFDGHGGDEVSKFCAKHIPEELPKLQAFKEKNYAQALKQVVLHMDEMLQDPEHEAEIAAYREVMIQKQVEKINNGEENTDPMFKTILELMENQEKEQTEQDDGVETAHTGEGDDDDNESGEDDEHDENDTNEVSGSHEENEEALQDGSTSNFKVVSVQKADKKTLTEDPEMIATEVEMIPVIKLSEDGTREISLEAHMPDNEQEHPEMMFSTSAGATAVISLIVDDEAYIANTGDSRAIIVRKGIAYPLSEDHKPNLERERARIYKAGGFINVQGRICDDLNLSRSIGDLRFKVDDDLSPEEQIVTADPDIKSFTLRSDDQFMVIACDGIWDVMKNQEVADFVLRQIKNGESRVSRIVELMLDKCLSPNLFQTNGLGGDNMTCIIVFLQSVEELKKARMATSLKKTLRRVFR